MRHFRSIFIFFVTFLIALVATACSGGGTTPAPTENTPAFVPTDIQDVWEGDQPISYISESNSDTAESITPYASTHDAPITVNSTATVLFSHYGDYEYDGRYILKNNSDVTVYFEIYNNLDYRLAHGNVLPNSSISGDLLQSTLERNLCDGKYSLHLETADSSTATVYFTYYVLDYCEFDQKEEENTHDASMQETDLPLYAEDWIDRIAVLEGGSLGNFPVQRYDGNGWYIYIPVSGWNKVQVDELFADDQWRWESEYQTGSILTIDHFTLPMEVQWADAQKQGYTPLDSKKYIWEMSGNGMSGQYYFSEAVDGGCWRVSIQWTDANITDYPHIAMEPNVLRLMAESFAVSADEQKDKDIRG